LLSFLLSIILFNTKKRGKKDKKDRFSFSYPIFIDDIQSRKKESKKMTRLQYITVLIFILQIALVQSSPVPFPSYSTKNYGSNNTVESAHTHKKKCHKHSKIQNVPTITPVYVPPPPSSPLSSDMVTTAVEAATAIPTSTPCTESRSPVIVPTPVYVPPPAPVVLQTEVEAATVAPASTPCTTPIRTSVYETIVPSTAVEAATVTPTVVPSSTPCPDHFSTAVEAATVTPTVVPSSTPCPDHLSTAVEAATVNPTVPTSTPTTTPIKYKCRKHSSYGYNRNSPSSSYSNSSPVVLGNQVGNVPSPSSYEGNSDTSTGDVNVNTTHPDYTNMNPDTYNNGDYNNNYSNMNNSSNGYEGTSSSSIASYSIISPTPTPGPSSSVGGVNVNTYATMTTIPTSVTTVIVPTSTIYQAMSSSTPAYVAPNGAPYGY